MLMLYVARRVVVFFFFIWGEGSTEHEASDEARQKWDSGAGEGRVGLCGVAEAETEKNKDCRKGSCCPDKGCPSCATADTGNMFIDRNCDC